MSDMSPTTPDPIQADYRAATGAANCGNCAHNDNGDCVLWDKPISPTMVCNAHEPYTEEDDNAELDLNDDGDPDVSLAVGKKGSGVQARWPKGSPNGKGGQFMEVADILTEVDRAGSADLTPFVKAMRAQHVTDFRVGKTQNPNMMLAKLRVQAPHTPGTPNDAPQIANVGFFLARKALGVNMIENVIRNFDVGDRIEGLTYLGIKKFARRSYYNPYRVVSRLIRSQVRSAIPLLSEEADSMEFAELYCSASPGVDEDGLYWKDALPVGVLALSPGYDGRPIHKPLKVIEGRSPDPTEAIGLQDLVDAFEDGAIQHVTVPLSHADKPHENTGFVRKVRIAQTTVKGKLTKALQCGIEFTDPEIRKKAEQKSIANVSVGVGFDYHRKDDGKHYASVMQHLALTNKPWIPGMAPFSEGDPDPTIIPMFSEPTVEEPAAPEPPTRWGALQGLWARRGVLTDAIEKLSGKFELLDFDGDKALVYDQESGQSSAVPYLITEGVAALSQDAALPIEVDVPGLVPTNSAGEAEGTEERHADEADRGDDPAPEAPSNDPGAQLKRAQDARDEQLRQTNTPEGGDKQMSDTVTMLGFTEDQLRARLARADEMEKKDRERSVDDRIEALKNLGLAETPGFLKVVRNLLLADDGGSAVVMLSEDGTKKSMTASEIVNTLVDALPVKDGKIALAEQHVDLGHTAPEVDDTKDPKALAKAEADAAREFLFATT